MSASSWENVCLYVHLCVYHCVYTHQPVKQKKRSTNYKQSTNKQTHPQLSGRGRICHTNCIYCQIKKADYENAASFWVYIYSLSKQVVISLTCVFNLISFTMLCSEIVKVKKYVYSLLSVT